MKIIIIMLTTFGTIFSAYAQQTDTVKTTTGIQTIQIKTSAVCDMCKEALEKAMAYEKGVKKSELDVASKVLTVTFDTKKTTVEKIKKAVTETGYDADELPANPAAYENLHACCKKDVKH
jgi:periplasmic mercuric ion binding protein